MGDEFLVVEYVDFIVGYFKLGWKGEIFYVRLVDYFELGCDVLRDEIDDGFFEKMRSLFEGFFLGGLVDFFGLFVVWWKWVEMDGEKVGKYKDVWGFRLYVEYGYIFWRFNVEIELWDK